MSTPSGIDPTAASGSIEPVAGTPLNWREALADLVTSRLALIQLESQVAVRQAVRFVAMIAVAGLAVLFAWGLVVVGTIGALATAARWPWYWIALVAALLHAVVVVVCIMLIKSAKTPVFPVTRNEFQKDRQWLQTLKSPRK